MLALTLLLSLSALVVSSLPIVSNHTLAKRIYDVKPMTDDFPDPSLIKYNSRYYAFATNGDGTKVRMATSYDGVHDWMLVTDDAIPTLGKWAKSDSVNWGPAVLQVGNTFVLYYTAQVADSSKDMMCIGAAISSNIQGPYTDSNDNALICPSTIVNNKQVGVVDPFAYIDNNQIYLAYKQDSNRAGGPKCGNTDPLTDTPLLLQQLDATGLKTKSGSNPTTIMTLQEGDGPAIQGPTIFKLGAKYFLLFGSDCWTSDNYFISYASADAIGGPYARGPAKLMQTDASKSFYSPGGPSALTDGDQALLAFHTNVGEHHDGHRKMHLAILKVDGSNPNALVVSAPA